RWGLMLMADPAAALRESRRVLRPGGPLAFAVWGAPDLNPWAAVPGATLAQLGHVPPPQPGAPGIFALGDAERTLGLVRAAGFAETQIQELTFAFHYADEEDFWDAIMRLAGPLARAVLALPDDERRGAREAIIHNMASFRNDDGSYTAPASTWVVLAR